MTSVSCRHNTLNHEKGKSWRYFRNMEDSGRYQKETGTWENRRGRRCENRALDAEGFREQVESKWNYRPT